jgi:hypothetical protein
MSILVKIILAYLDLSVVCTLLWIMAGMNGCDRAVRRRPSEEKKLLPPS